MNPVESRDDGAHILKARIYGPGGSTDIDAILDTGFSCFVMLPFVMCFPLKLPVVGTQDLKAIDGRTISRMMAEAELEFEGRRETVHVILEPERKEVILGTAFLKKFGKRLALVSANE